MIQLELHSHSRYSPDSLNRLEDIVHACRQAGIDRIAITDHNAVAGALKARELAPDLVIVGEEVMTTEGELLCYFIDQLIPRGLTLDLVIQRVHDQGGIVGAAHPYDPRRAGIGPDNLERLRSRIDFVEVYNARTRNPQANESARQLAADLGLPGTCGSDAHTLAEIGRCRVRMREYTSPQDFLAALREAELVTQPSSWHVSFGSRLAALTHWLGMAPKSR